nr:methyl-accepting chemotaxis protein [Shewanella sp. SACH]
MFLVLATLISVLAIVLILSLSVIRYLHDSVHHLYSTITQARKHYDLSVRLTQTSSDEFGELAIAFNDMMSDFEKVILHVRSSGAKLQQAVAQMDVCTHAMEQDVMAGHSEAEQIATATHEQSAVSEDVNRNALKISEIYLNTQRISDELRELTKALTFDANLMSKEVHKFTVN